MPTPTADTVPGVERAPGRKKTVGQRYVETLGVDEVARAARSARRVSQMFDTGGAADLGGASASLSAASKMFGASNAANDMLKQLSGITSRSEEFSKLSTLSGFTKQTGLISEAVRAAGMVDTLELASMRTAALAGLTVAPRVDSQLSALSKSFGASNAANDMLKQLSGITSRSEEFSKLSTLSGFTKQTGLISEAVRAAGMVDTLELASMRTAALAGLTVAPRIDSQLSALSKSFGASNAANDMLKQLSGITSRSEEFSKLSTLSGFTKQTGLISEAVRAIGSMDSGGLPGRPLPSMVLDLESLVLPLEDFLPAATDEWEQTESGLWTRPTAEDFWAYLIAATLTLRVVAWYFSEENRIGAPLSEINRAGLLMEAWGFWQLAKFIEGRVRSSYRWITNVAQCDDQ